MCLNIDPTLRMDLQDQHLILILYQLYQQLEGYLEDRGRNCPRGSTLLTNASGRDFPGDQNSAFGLAMDNHGEAFA